MIQGPEEEIQSTASNNVTLASLLPLAYSFGGDLLSHPLVQNNLKLNNGDSPTEQAQKMLGAAIASVLIFGSIGYLIRKWRTYQPWERVTTKDNYGTRTAIVVNGEEVFHHNEPYPNPGSHHLTIPERPSVQSLGKVLRRRVDISDPQYPFIKEVDFGDITCNITDPKFPIQIDYRTEGNFLNELLTSVADPELIKMSKNLKKADRYKLLERLSGHFMKSLKSNNTVEFDLPFNETTRISYTTDNINELLLEFFRTDRVLGNLDEDFADYLKFKKYTTPNYSDLSLDQLLRLSSIGDMNAMEPNELCDLFIQFYNEQILGLKRSLSLDQIGNNPMHLLPDQFDDEDEIY